MNRTVSLLVCMMMAFGIVSAQDLSLDEILLKHYKAIGISELQKINSVIMTGTMIQNDAMPVKITRKRPGSYLMEFDIQDITAFQGYDGQNAWWTTPWAGNPKPQPMPADRAKDMKLRADFDGILYNWKAKGHTVELQGKDTIEKTITYKLKVTKKDGGEEFLFLDAEKFTILKRLYYRNIRGQEVAMENYFRDYKPVKGILFSFTQETQLGGQPYNSLQFDSIILNEPVDDKIFSMPSGLGPE